MIKQPVVLGYIIAGFLIGPHLNLFPTVADETNIKTLSEIGVIFLLFGLGLEFSFKKLMRVGGSASVTALVEIIFIVIAGYLTGQALGWSKMDCIFLGGMLASSSTTIIIRAFDELGVKNRSYAKTVFGVLVVEDLVVILLMVLLSTIAVTQHIEGTELLFTIGKLLFFLILWIVLGIYLIPSFLKKIKSKMDDEGYLILSLGLCLMMVVLAVSVGFSAELGAFIMGSILAETTSAEKIEHVTKPVKDLFGAIFFVSIGMMIDPKAMVDYGWIIGLITLLVVVGKVLSTTAGAVLSGQSLRQSIHVGMSMAQIGEFAFIVATLGMSLGVISDFLFPIAVGVSAITTFTTPYLIKYADNFYFFLERILPERTLKAIDNYTTSTKTIQAEIEWKRFTKAYWVSSLGNAVILLAIVLAGTQFFQPFLLKMLPLFTANMITLGVVLLVSSPFLWALMFKLPNNAEYKDLWTSRDYKNGPLLVMGFVRLFIGLGVIGYFTHALFLTWTSAFIVIGIVIIALILSSRYLLKVYTRIEKRFMSNYNSREIAEAASSTNMFKKEFTYAKQSSWDIDLIDLEMRQDSCFIGEMIKDLGW